MKRAERVVELLLSDEQIHPVAANGVQRTGRLGEGRIYQDAWEAEASVPPSGWRGWRAAGGWFSPFHKEGTPFPLPFHPDNYVWAGPFTLRLPVKDVESARRGFRWAHYQRGVRKYANMLTKGLKPPPVILLYHEAGDLEAGPELARVPKSKRPGGPTRCRRSSSACPSRWRSP